MASELDKYRTIYGDTTGRWARYGHTNHGAKAMPLVEGVPTLLDVGCGHNEFAIACRARGIAAMGVDFACPDADMIAPAQSLPFEPKKYHTLTAFDMLEHLRPEDVATVLREFARVSSHYVFSISYVPSVNKVAGETLHPCVRPEAWWIQRIHEAGGSVKKTGHYLHGDWGDPRPAPVAPGESVVLVGNGPQILQAEQGAEIDAHDQVVRFNRYVTRGFERHTGTKTTLWSTFGRGYTPGPDEAPPARIIFIHGDNGAPALPASELWRIQISYFNQLRVRVQAESEREAERRDKTIPSSGLLVSAWLLEILEIDSPLRLAGFDHFKKERSRQHHYWNPKTFGRPGEHDGDAEAAIFARWEADGRVVRL